MSPYKNAGRGKIAPAGVGMPACAVFGLRRGPFELLRLRGLHAQLVADELEGRGDGLVHVVVLVTA